MVALNTKFTEIEHKFLIDSDFDRQSFIATLQRLKPTKEIKVKVRDTYFLLNANKYCIIRHRYDEKTQQLSLKSFGAADNESRLEINLYLEQLAGDQIEAVTAFIGALGKHRSGEILKDIHVFYFSDCEVVIYDAKSDSRAVSCVEFEAVAASCLQQGLATIDKYEQLCGFSADRRCHESLFELLLAKDFPPEKA